MESEVSRVPVADAARNSYCLEQMEKLNRFRHEKLLCDVTLVVEEQEFAAHRGVLAASSPYFYSLFTTDMKEQTARRIELPELKLSAMDELLSYLYTGQVNARQTNAEELVECANYLSLPRLKDVACKTLERNATPANCVYLFAFADKYNCTELSQCAQALMKQNFATSSVGMSTGLQTLSVGQLEDLISSDGIVVNAEEEILETVLAWIMADEGSREQYLARLFRHVRLSLISEYYFHTKLTSNPVIRGNSECMELVLQAIKWRVLHSGEELPRQKPRNCLKTHVDAVLTCGGLSPEGHVSDLTWCYVPSDKSWHQLAPMEVKRCRHGFQGCREFLYAIGGKGEEYFHQSVERFDPRTNTWTQVAPMPAKVKLVGTGSLDGCLYVLGGIQFTEQGRRRCATVLKYIPSTNVWDAAAPLNTRRSSTCVVTDEHFLYAIGGLGDHGFLNDVERYDPRLNSWTKLAPTLEKRGCACGVLVRGKIFIFGGTVDAFSQRAMQSCETFDVSLNEWQMIAPMRIPRFHAGAVLVRGVVYVFGGIGGANIKWSDMKSVECYSLESNKWLAEHEMPFEETFFRGCSVSLYKPLLKSLSEFK